MKTITTLLALSIASTAGVAAAQTLPAPARTPAPAAATANKGAAGTPSAAGALKASVPPVQSSPALQQAPQQTAQTQAPAAGAQRAQGAAPAAGPAGTGAGYTPMQSVSPPWNAGYQHTRIHPVRNYRPDMTFTKARMPRGWEHSRSVATAEGGSDERALVSIGGTEY